MDWRGFCRTSDLSVRPRWSWWSTTAIWLLVGVVMTTDTLAVSPIVGETGRRVYDPDWPEVHLIITAKCLSCHRPGADVSDLSDLAANGEDTSGEDVVVPGNPDASQLWEYLAWNVDEHVVSDQPDEPMMPIEKSEWLSAGQLQAVYRWIKNGANVYASPSASHRAPVTELQFPSARVCAGCHPNQYDQWSRSMHAYAQHSPVFEAFTLTLVERTSGTIGTFCSRCHTPIGTALGENESQRNVCRSRISLEGVTCIVCHRRSTAHYKNNGRLPIEPGMIDETCMYGPFESSLSLENGGHGAGKFPYIKTSQFCGECHDVVSPSGVRNEEAFSEWQHSPAARDGITCQQCHMGPIQGVPIADCERPLGRAAQVPEVPADRLPLRHLTDHTFAGPDYSLLPDTEFPHRLDWMYETDYRDQKKLTEYQRTTLKQLRIRNRASLKKAFDKRIELLGNAARLVVRHPKSAACGERVQVRVDVTSLVAGHNLPTGFAAERQLWVAVEVLDPTGRVVFASGDLDRNQDLRDEHSHAILAGKMHWDRHLLNFQSQFTALTSKGTERTVVLPVNRHLIPLSFVRPATIPAASFGRPGTFRIAKGSLPPLKTIGQSYPVQLAQRTGLYTVNVRLQFRHLPPALLDAIGTPHLKHLLEIVVMDEYQGLIHVKGTDHSSYPSR